MQQWITVIMATNGQSRNKDDRWTKHHRNTFFLAETIVRNKTMVNEIIAWLFRQIMLTWVKIAGELWLGWIRKVCKMRWCLTGIWAGEYQRLRAILGGHVTYLLTATVMVKPRFCLPIACDWLNALTLWFVIIKNFQTFPDWSWSDNDESTC